MTRTPALKSSLTVAPPQLHGGQLDVLNHPARFKLLRAGRRWRKSGLGVVQAFTGYDGPDRKFLGALTGGQVGWWVPSLTARYLVTDWHPIRALAAQIPGSRIEEANHRVIVPGGGSIIMLSGDNNDSGRGLGLDGAVLDEATLLSEPLWNETIQATLIDRLGWALFCYTPKGLDWVFELDEATKDDPDWQSFHFTSLDNPFVQPAEIERLARNMPTLVRQQELEAEYVTGGAGVFRADWIQHYYTRWVEGERILMMGENHPLPLADCSVFHTVDLAWTQEEDSDFTVISTWANGPGGNLLLLNVVRDRFEGPDIVPQMAIAYERWGGVLVVERATRQLSIIQEAVRQNLPVREVRPDKDKLARALTAQARMEQGKVWFPPRTEPWYHAVEAELLAFPVGRHDDFVDTFAYAVLETSRRSRYEDEPLRTV